jgi:serine/threonine protein kinase
MQDLYPKSFGKYLLTKRVAVGGMAEVFKAKLLGAKGFEKTLAVKRILPEYSNDEEFVSMFVDEARISSNLHHKNIVQVFEFGEVNHQYYLTMEFIDGCNLKNLFFRVLKSNKRLPRELIYFIILKTASALDYAHKVKMEDQIQPLQLVHRDVSPQNILISKMGDIKITDFGIAKAAIKLSQTQPGKIQGKYSYMSPEQALGKPLNHQSDIFSLGIVFYELLTAKKVYGSTETIKRYTEATKASIPRIGSILTDLPDQIDTIIMRMVSRNAYDRPKDCTEVIDTLTEFLSSSSDEAYSTQLGEIVQELFPEETMQTVQDRSAGLSERSHIRVDLRPSLPEAIKSLVTKGAPGESNVKLWVKRIGVAALLIAILGSVPWLWKQYKKDRPQVVTEVTEQETEKVPEQTSIKPPEEPKNTEVQNMEMQLSQLDDEIDIVQSEIKKSTTPEKPKVENEEESEEANVAAPPPPGCPSEMATIDGGEFIMGSNDKDRNELVELSARKKEVKKYCIDKYEYPNQRDVLPLRNVSWNEASDLCAKNRKRLCSESEWERSCKGAWSGMVNQQFSYGNTWKDNACNVKNFNSLVEDRVGEVAQAGDYPDCSSAEGVYDLNGNLQEWTASTGKDSSKQVIKGGSFLTPQFQSRCSFYREETPLHKQDDIGFRCCKDF